MSQRPIVRPPRRPKPPSFVKTVVFYLGLLIVSSAVTALFSFPTSPGDFALIVAIVMAFEATGFALHALWARITRKRRREELMG